MQKSEVVYKRKLCIEAPRGQSLFLWGARKTGKSFYLKKHFPNSICYDLLKTDEYFRLLKNPHLLREKILALDSEKLAEPIIIDEIQKIPVLLDEVHYLIENSDVYFILCGSSARQLKRTGVNLLGGRAWRFVFFPLVSEEIPDFDLLKALNRGLISTHYNAVNWKRSAGVYVSEYLKEEVKSEGLVRNLKAFSEFLDVAAFSNGEMVNFANIARDCGVDSKTVKEYYQILVDTMLGYFLYPYKKSKKRDHLVSTPKFYYFDVGIVNFLSKRQLSTLKGIEVGSVFEHFIFIELVAYKGICDKEFEITFWRTKLGLEVDFILGNAEIAIEIKVSEKIRVSELKGLVAFQKEYQPKRAIVVCNSPNRRIIEVDQENSIEVLPWKQFLKMLWSNKIVLNGMF